MFEIKFVKLGVHNIKQRGGVDNQLSLPGSQNEKQGKK